MTRSPRRAIPSPPAGVVPGRVSLRAERRLVSETGRPPKRRLADLAEVTYRRLVADWQSSRVIRLRVGISTEVGTVGGQPLAVLGLYPAETRRCRAHAAPQRCLDLRRHVAGPRHCSARHVRRPRERRPRHRIMYPWTTEARRFSRSRSSFPSRWSRCACGCRRRVASSRNRRSGRRRQRALVFTDHSLREGLLVAVGIDDLDRASDPVGRSPSPRSQTPARKALSRADGGVYIWPVALFGHRGVGGEPCGES